MKLLNPRLIALYPTAKTSYHSLSGLFRFPAPLINPSLHRSCRRFCSSSNSPVRETVTMATPQRNVHVKEQIDLTSKEKQIFDCLLKVLQQFNLQTQLRVAGGWVRDKLLGKECYDIDIALDDMLGREFCEKVNEYVSSTGGEVRGVGVIQSNPDQSKHLETATMRLFDEWIDFVNLRSEDYSETSRIPAMRFGTAEEDAFRRDLTINSLFYNINTNSVEDFTGRGISDLKSGKIVTPLPPKQTFLDDPLRVLRAIRFGSRFGFELDGDLKIAASDDDVKAAIASKISRERIGKEVDLMMSGNQPILSMSYICELQLFFTIFSHPPNTEHLSREGLERVSVEYVDFSWRLLQLIDSSKFTDDQRRLGLYAALFLPFRNAVYADNKGKKIPVVSYIFRTSLKLKSNDADSVIRMHVATNRLLSLIPSIMASEKLQPLEVTWKRQLVEVPVAANLRVLAGFALREIKELWRPSLLLSLLLYPGDVGSSDKSSNEDTKLNQRRDMFFSIENAICDMGLDKIWELKPLVNGKDIMSILHIKPGPDVKEWQEKLMEWQLAHPSGSAEVCIEWMKETHQSKRARIE